MPAAYRFLASGLPDDGFGSGGAVATRFSDASAGVARQVIMPDDRSIVVAGLSDNAGDAGVSGVGLLKLAVDGTPDSSFGNLPGLPGRTFISDDSLLDVRIVSLAGGLPVTFLRRNNNNDTIHLAKVLADGRIDSSYGTNGVRSTGVPSQNIVTFIFNDSLLRVIGTYNPPGSPKRIQLLRFSANLEPDPGFGLDGYRLLPAIGGKHGQCAAQCTPTAQRKAAPSRSCIAGSI